MTQATSTNVPPLSAGGAPAGAGRPGGPPPGVTAGGPPAGAGAHAMVGTSSGFEGREADLGRAVALAIRTLKDTVPYQHEMNDALVKVHLLAVQFAKNRGLLPEFVEHDIRTMAPMLARIRGAIEKSGNKDIALVGVFDRTPCLYQLCLDLEGSDGRRTFTSPWRTVLEMGRRIGQFDLTEREVHESWIKPRLNGYAAAMGVRFDVSDIGADGKVTVKVLD